MQSFTNKIGLFIVSAKQINTQYQIPQGRGSLNAYQPVADEPRFAAEASARLELQQVYYNSVNAERPVEVIQAEHVRASAEHPTFSQVEPFLYTVGDWMEFNRNEATGHGKVA